jgi:hypothetical protein
LEEVASREAISNERLKVQAEEWRATVQQALAERDAQLAEVERARAAAAAAREEGAATASSLREAHEGEVRRRGADEESLRSQLRALADGESELLAELGRYVFIRQRRFSL